MGFDSGYQGLAQRYYLQALRLAQAGGHRALGAHILANMSKQAHYLCKPSQALELATAGYRTALDCGSPSTVAKCASQLGRAHAVQGDQRGCAQACAVAERMLDRPTSERTRFTADHMLGEQLYMADELGCARDVQRIAPEALASSPGGARRYVQYTTVLAASYLPAAGNPHSDLDRACELLGQVLPALGSLHSARCVERVNTVRRALDAHTDRPCVREFEDRYRTTVTAV